MTSQEELLLAEYRHCTEVPNHIDNLRNVLTSFFLTINGGLLLAASLVLERQAPTDILGSPEAFLSVLLFSVAILGTLFVATIARMRRIQLERYRIANSILDAMLQSPLREVVPYSNDLLSEEAGGHGLDKRATGSYLWTLSILLPTASLAGFAISLVLERTKPSLESPWLAIAGVLTAVIVFVANDLLYFRLSESQ